MGSYYGIMLRNHITGSAHGIILMNDIMELYYGIIYEKDPGDARDIPGAPWYPGEALGTPL